jgi:periplasmic protein TonB
MEAKKNPAKDIHRMSFMFFQIGLGISIALVITAFEWRTEVRKPRPRITAQDDFTLVLIPPTIHTNPEPQAPQPEKQAIKPKSIDVISDEPLEAKGEEPDAITIDQTELPSSKSINLPTEEPEICHDCLISFPDRPAEPVGGYEGFYSIIRKNLKYPRQAQRMDVQGKVTVEFIVNRDGVPSDFKIIRGIGAGCDEEAMRVLALTKWNPGKQRGKPVRVKMIMPITFVLN